MTAKRALGRLLRKAYSGELAAAHAYRGHARSVRDAAQREAIRGIEDDEWRHRQRVGEMLAELSVRPARAREVVFYCIGKLIALSCFLGGWFIPMYGAGRIERRNIVEYEVAARLAQRAGYETWVDELLEMAEVEWDHEQYFGECVRGHWLYRWFPNWPSAGTREAIRQRFASQSEADSAAMGGA